jgi:threonine dehydratase
MYGLYHFGSQDRLVELPSLADGLAGPVEDGAITIPLVRQYVDELILVNETEIAHAIFYAWDNYHERIEGSAAVPLAAVLTGKVTARPAVLVISGGNIQPEVHQMIVEGSQWKA